MKFGLTWKCPHHPNGCDDGGPYSERALACRADVTTWALFRKAVDSVKPIMKKPVLKDEDKQALTKWMDSEFEKDYPHLFAFLTADTWEDKTTRTTGTLLLFTQDGYLKACLNDRALDRSCFVSAPSLTLLFDLVEDGLEEDHLEWRKRRGQ